MGLASSEKNQLILPTQDGFYQRFSLTTARVQSLEDDKMCTSAVRVRQMTTNDLARHHGGRDDEAREGNRQSTERC